MAIELQMLVYAGLLAVLQIVLFVALALPQVGIPWAVGPRDKAQTLTGTGGRAQRALANMFESLTLFAIAVLTASAAGRFGSETALAAQIYFWARVAYVPAYVFGIPWLRSLIWGVGLAATLIIFWQIL